MKLIDSPVHMITPPNVVGEFINVVLIRLWPSNAISILRRDGVSESCNLSQAEVVESQLDPVKLNNLVKSKRPDTTRIQCAVQHANT